MQLSFQLDLLRSSCASTAAAINSRRVAFRMHNEPTIVIEGGDGVKSTRAAREEQRPRREDRANDVRGANPLWDRLRTARVFISFFFVQHVGHRSRRRPCRDVP